MLLYMLVADTNTKVITMMIPTHWLLPTHWLFIVILKLKYGRLVNFTSQLGKMKQLCVGVRVRSGASWPIHSRSGNQIGNTVCVP